MADVREEARLRAKVGACEAAMGKLMNDVEEATRALDIEAHEYDGPNWVEHLDPIVDCLIAARERARAAWVNWSKS